MFRSLQLRELGEEAYTTHAPTTITSLLTSSLHLNKSKTIRLEDHHHDYFRSIRYALDLDKQDSQYLLYTSQKSIKIYDVRSEETSGKVVGGHEFEQGESGRRCKWYPESVGMFIVGDYKGNVGIWDSNEMGCVSKHKVMGSHMNEDGDKIRGMDITRMIHGPTKNLVAVASGGSHHVHLLDISSGGFTHTLMGHSAPVSDVVWSPVSPYLVASASNDSTVKLFDVRKGGYRACLTTFDHNRILPILEESGGVCVPGGGIKGEDGLVRLGLGMDWISRSAHSERRRSSEKVLKDRAREGSVLSHLGPVVRCRFTSDGSRLLTTTNDHSLRCWDSLSGHCVSSRFLSKSKPGFEVGIDPHTVYVPDRDYLVTLDVETLSKVAQSHAKGCFGINEIFAHAQLEDVCASSPYKILWWSPKRNKKSRKQGEKGEAGLDPDSQEDSSIAHGRVEGSEETT